MQTFPKEIHFTRGKTLALTVLGFSLLYCVCFAAIFPADKLMAPGDGWRTFAPYFYAKKTFWLDLVCTGYPTIADPQFQFWYPLALIFQCFHSYNGFIISAYVIASCCAYLFTYTLTKSKLAGTVSGICFGMSGFLLAHLEHTPMAHAAIWTPLILNAVEKLHQRINSFWFTVGALAVCMTILGGHPQISVYGLGLAIIYALYTTFRQKELRLQYFIAILGMFILGVGLASIQIIPTIEWIHQSTRESMPYNRFISHPIIPVEFWQLVYPNLCSTFYNEISCYMGILSLLLLITAILIRQYNSHFIFWFSTIIMAICLMLGDATPLAKIMYHIPAYNLFRCVCRHGLEFTIAFSTLAGMIVNDIQTTSQKKSLLKYGVIACVLFAILVSLGTYWSQNNFIEYTQNYAKHAGLGYLNLNPLENKAISIPVVVILASMASFLIWLQRPMVTWRKVLLVAMLTSDLFLANFWLNTEHTFYFLPAKSIRRNPPPIAVCVNNLLYHSNQRLLPIPTYEHMYAYMAENGVAPNLAMFWNIPIASGYPARFKRYAELTHITECGFAHSLFDPVGCELDLACIKYVLHPDIRILDIYPDLNNNNRFKKITTIGPCTIFENLHAMPRAWLTNKIISLPAHGVLQTIHSCRLPDGSRFSPTQMALVEDALVPKINSDIANGAVQIIKLKNTFEELKTNSSKPTMLVVSDLFYPGWEAKVDGESSKIYITDYAFRGVFLKPGEHQITFEYKPQSLYWGMAISSLSLFVLVLISISMRPPVMRRNQPCPKLAINLGAASKW